MHKLSILLTAATLGTAVLISTEASARGGHHGGWHGGGHHGGWHGRGWHHGGWHGGGWHGGGWRRGGYGYGGYGGCGRRWVLGPYGGHWVRRCW